MFDIDYIIPCYGHADIIRPGLRELANQWHSEYIHVTLVDDCSPNTDCHYQDLVDEFKPYLDIRVLVMPENSGQGLARQMGIDNCRYDYFMLQDEDDRLGSPIAVSLFIGAAENILYTTKEDDPSLYILDKDGKMIPSGRSVALISGNLLEFDDNHTHVIQSDNPLWVNSKLYNKKFLDKYNIRFNVEQSRHAEDYFFSTCLFFTLEFISQYDTEFEWYCANLDDSNLCYLWYPNEDSQSRKDPYYGHTIAGYTMCGANNILKWEENTVKKYNLQNDKDACNAIKEKTLNMTIYSFISLHSFIRSVVINKDYIPAKEDWDTLVKGCKDLVHRSRKYHFLTSEIIDQFYFVKNCSDIIFAETWIDLNTYLKQDCDEFNMSYEDLLKLKTNKKYIFDERGVRVQ